MLFVFSAHIVEKITYLNDYSYKNTHINQIGARLLDILPLVESDQTLGGVDDLSVNNRSIDNLRVDDLSVEYLSVKDQSVDYLSVDGVSTI